MKLKFTLRRPGGSSADLVAQLDATATVGDLAAHLAGSDPDGSHAVHAGEGTVLTLALADQNGAALDPAGLIVEAPLGSGATVSLTAASQSYHATNSQDGSAARLRVLAGPDQGRELGLPAGSSVVGRDADCDVVLNDPMVSRRHARINVTNTVEIIDQGSANGVLVGGEAVPRVTLRSGDVVTIGDTEFVVTLIHRSARTRGPVEFIRPPVLMPVHEGREFEPPQPPERPRPQRFPTIALIAPLIMGAILFLVTHKWYSVIFVALSPLMLIGSAVEGRMAARREFKQAVAEFESDLAGFTDEVREELAREVEARKAEHPSAAEMVDAALKRGPLLWCRRPDVDRFGELRLGLGTLPTRSTFKLPSRNKAPHELVLRAQQAVDALRTVEGVPVVADLRESAVGLAGPRTSMLASARAQVLESVTLHSPAELVLAGVFGSDTAADWEWLKWLPHTSAPNSPLTRRHLASSQAAATALVGEIESLLEDRSESDVAEPAVLLVVDSGAPVEHSRLVSLAERGAGLGVHVLWLAPAVEQLPAACQVFLDVTPASTEGRAGYVVRGEDVTPVRLELVDAATAETVARSLAPVIDLGARADDSSDLPRAVSQFALLGPELGSQPESVLERWLQNSSVLSGPRAPQPVPRKAGNLRAVLGQSADGPHALDLRADGPHALVGGTTGAGKSELLQSWILSLAAAHSPERVTFLLVDYKGGSAFSDCVDLPHTIGLVTDLSPHMVRRALTSLSAELRYREELLAEHGAKDLVELESHGVAGAPPSLVIVVDEFAALVQEVPEFVDGVVNVAQRGRSLGLHLILATQRPAGVIKDNLRANTNLRVALRMADEADSADVLGSDAAAAFDPSIPGRAMSKSGPTRLVAFQTAYAGGWTSDVPEPPDVTVEELSIAAPVRWEPREPAVAGAKDRSATDIKRLVRSIREANALASLPAPRKAWLPELRAAYDIAVLPSRRRDDELMFAVADDPERQQQPPVAFRPDREGNLAVFGTGGAGKSTLLRSIAVAAGFSGRGGPCHVYGLDFGSRGLAMLEVLPHVGSIIVGSDHERVTRLITWLRQEIDDRAVRYSAASAATITDYRRISGHTDEPRILVLVDGIAAFRQAYETTDRARYIDLLTAIASEGRPVGIHLVISSDQRSGMHAALSSAVQRRLVLRMATEDDYSMLGVATDVLDQHAPPGRALDDGHEIQVAVLGGDADVVTQAAQIAEFATALREVGTKDAPPIRSLPADVPLASLGGSAEGGVPLGLESAGLSPFAVEARACFVITGPPSSGRSTALRTLVESTSRYLHGAELHYLGHRRSELAAWSGWRSRSLTPDEIAAAATALAAELPLRPPGSPRVVVVLESAGDLVSGPADMALQSLAKACIAEDQWFVVEGEVSTLRTTMGFLGVVKSSRRGLALQPDQESGAALFNTPFPRVNRNDFPPGRGFLVGSGRASLVQVATTHGTGG